VQPMGQDQAVIGSGQGVLPPRAAHEVAVCTSGRDHACRKGELPAQGNAAVQGDFTQQVFSTHSRECGP